MCVQHEEYRKNESFGGVAVSVRKTKDIMVFLPSLHEPKYPISETDTPRDLG